MLMSGSQAAGLAQRQAGPQAHATPQAPPFPYGPLGRLCDLGQVFEAQLIHLRSFLIPFPWVSGHLREGRAGWVQSFSPPDLDSRRRPFRTWYWGADGEGVGGSG